MGSLESGTSLKKDHSLHRSGSATGRSFNQRFARLVFFKKIDFVSLICTVAAFLFFIVLCQVLLLGSFLEKSSGVFLKSNKDYHQKKVDEKSSDLVAFLKEFNGLDFGEDIKFQPSKILAKFKKEEEALQVSRNVSRFGYRKPKLAMVFGDLLVDPYQIQMATIAAALKELGYEIEVFSLHDGPVRKVWKDIGDSLNVLETNETMDIAIDWLSYEGILVNSLDASGIFSRLMQEPFKNVPVIWTIHEQTLAARLRDYASSGQNGLVNNWRKVFSRATVVVFHNYILPMMYSTCDAGNYFVIPGSPTEAWEADNFMALDKSNTRARMDYGSNDFIIVVVGNQLLYKGLWLEHTVVLQALSPLLKDFPSDGNTSSPLKLVILAGDSNINYSMVIQTIATKLSYPVGMVKHVAFDGNVDRILSIADLVIYSSFLDGKSFPNILLKAMCLEKPIIAADLPIIRKYVDDRVNGYLFPKEDVRFLWQIMMQVISNGKLSLLARKAAAIGKHTAKNLMVFETVEGYALLLENILRFPSEVINVQDVTKIPSNMKAEWLWNPFETIRDSNFKNETRDLSKYLDKVEKQWIHTPKENSVYVTSTNENFVYGIWEEQKAIDMANVRKRREDEELKDRTDHPRRNWEEVYRNARRADRSKNELHERDEGELERTGQPLCIYEPFLGQGPWPFLHRTALYRGLGLSSRDRRPGADDVDAPSRLALLNNLYYRDALGEFGAFFAIANRIDRMHKNAWIGFQSWRATARKESLSKTAENSLLDAIQSRRHDTLYFWARMDMDPRNPQKQEFWTFCDAINAGNCRFAFSEALKKMYGIKNNSTSLPPMPNDGDTWSVMHSWVLPTKSFLEFVMFSRMFVDALDSEFYEQHHVSGHCYLSLATDKHCYSRMLELLVNVWAYHSARSIVYVNPENGLMQEQHKLKNRRGQMWVKWFQFSTLKSMDGDLAEVADSDPPKGHWLWPSTGEVYWHGIFERERNLRNREKEKKRQQSKDKISRIRKRARQKTIGKYVKPPPEEDMQESNSTATTAKVSR